MKLALIAAGSGLLASFFLIGVGLCSVGLEYKPGFIL